MLKRFWKVLALNKNQNEIELDGKKIAIGKKEKRMARISQSIMEFIPLFAMFVFVNNPHLIEIEKRLWYNNAVKRQEVLYFIYSNEVGYGRIFWRSK